MKNNKHNHDLVLGYITLAIEVIRFASRVVELLNVVINYPATYFVSKISFKISA
jgi:hypothetical protein